MLLHGMDVSKLEVGQRITLSYIAQSDGKRHPDEHHTKPRVISGVFEKFHANGGILLYNEKFPHGRHFRSVQPAGGWNFRPATADEVVDTRKKG